MTHCKESEVTEINSKWNAVCLTRLEFYLSFCNPSMWKVETNESGVQGQSRLREFLSFEQQQQKKSTLFPHFEKKK